MLKLLLLLHRLKGFGAGLVLAVGLTSSAQAFERYSDCRSCHGDFTGSQSPKGTTFPGGDKHQMHRSSSNMDTACDLCHSSGDNRNPYIGSSDGTSDNPGLGCTGCHQAAGLRAHHDRNGVGSCIDCHGTEAAPPESTSPPYYGTADTKADNPCNDNPIANSGENWSVGDFLGLDNDGDNLYDQADFDCGPDYLLTDVTIEGTDVRITWETVGGRTDVLQSATEASGSYTDIPGSRTPIPGVGIVTTDFVIADGATGGTHFYRIRSDP